MSAADGSGSKGAGALVEAGLRALAGDQADETLSLVRNPVGYVFGAIAVWIIKNVFIKPSLFFLGLINQGTSIIEGAIATADSSLTLGFSRAGAGILGVRQVVEGALISALMNAGIAAPFAATIIAVIYLIAVVVVSYLLVRIILDVIPGGGALIR
jgi:hypothetical protein